MGSSGYVWTSPLGTAGTWTYRPTGTNLDLRGITFADGLLVAVGGNYSSSSLILTSPDGITWTPRSSPTSQVLYSVIKAGAEFVVTGYDGVVITSPDAITWTLRPAPTTHELLGCGWNGQELLVCGEGGSILASSAGTTPGGYATWSAANIPAGQNAAFDADWNRDGILNGVAYVFGSTRFSPTGKGGVPAPPAIPADVNLFLERSTTLAAGSWTPVASWVNGAAPALASDVSIVSGEVRDTFTGPRASYRYRVVLR